MEHKLQVGDKVRDVLSGRLYAIESVEHEGTFYHTNRVNGIKSHFGDDGIDRGDFVVVGRAGKKVKQGK